MAIDKSIKDAERYVFIELANSDMNISDIETSFHKNGGYLRGLDISKVQGASDLKSIKWEGFDSGIEIINGQSPYINLEVIKTQRYVSLSFMSDNPIEMTSLESAFACNEYLDDIDMSVFTGVKSIKNTFAGTNNFKGIIPESFNGNNPTMIDGAFQDCTSLQNVPFDSFSLVQSANHAFLNCSEITSFDFTNFPSLVNADEMISNTGVTEVDISMLSKVESAEGIFDNCGISGFVSGNETQIIADEIIKNKSSITKIKIKNYLRSKELYLEDGKYLFQNLDDVHIQDSTVVQIENLFFEPTKMKFLGCNNLKEVSPRVLDSVVDATDMFCEIQTLILIPWNDMGNIEIADRMFNGTSFSLAGEDPLGITNLKKVSSAEHMFSNSQALSKMTIGSESDVVARAICEQIPNVPTYLEILDIDALENYKDDEGKIILAGLTSVDIKDNEITELDIRPYFKFLVNFKDCSDLFSVHASTGQIHNDMFFNCEAMRELHLYDTKGIPTDAMNVHGDAIFYDDVYVKGTLHTEGQEVRTIKNEEISELIENLDNVDALSDNDYLITKVVEIPVDDEPVTMPLSKRVSFPNVFKWLKSKFSDYDSFTDDERENIKVAMGIGGPLTVVSKSGNVWVLSD